MNRITKRSRLGLVKVKKIETVVKADIVDRVYEKIGFTRNQAAEAVDIVFDEIKAVLGQGDNVRIVGFGSFNLRDKKARSARNPKTGEPITIEPRRVLTFKPSKQLLIETDR